VRLLRLVFSETNVTDEYTVGLVSLTMAMQQKRPLPPADTYCRKYDTER
jgi:hypothetical protein